MELCGSIRRPISVRLLSVVFAALVCAGCSVGSGSSATTAQGGSTHVSQPVLVGPLVRYRVRSITFTYPAAWRYRRPGWVGSIADNFVDLSAQPMRNPCHTNGDCNLPVSSLMPNDVVVEWVQSDIPRPRPPRPALRVSVSRPGSCKVVDATETVSAQVVTRAHRFFVRACLRGPDVAANEAAVRAMLASARS